MADDPQDPDGSGPDSAGFTATGKSLWQYFAMTLRRSAIVLILANLIPLAGVLMFDWRVLDILLLYWAESVIIGIINVLRMTVSRSDKLLRGLPGHEKRADALQKVPGTAKTALKFFIIPFFIVHYGAFCYGHIMGVVSLFGDGSFPGGIPDVVRLFKLPEYWIAIASIFISHMYSFFANFIGSGEYQTVGAMALMHRPYGRIVAMHIAIIAGGALVAWLGTPLPMLLVLIAIKMVIDVRLHEREREKLAVIA